MRVPRSVLWAVVMAAGFLYLSSGTSWDLGRWIRPTGRLWSEPASAATTYTPDEQNNIEIYKTGREATVNITSVVYRQNWMFQVYPEQGTGSGFIIKPTGEILTNNHVVNGARELTVTLADKKIYKAKVLAKDERVDLALIKIDAPGKLPSLTLGNSDALVVGQKVLAIGDPFGFQSTLTTGVVSALGRTVQTSETTFIDAAIQTDASINRGNSGGPLINTHGEVIGINSAIYTPSGTTAGIGFAIPINTAKLIANDLITEGRVRRAYLGVTTLAVAGWLAEALDLPVQDGLLVETTSKGSPAAAAGIHGGDRVAQAGMRQIYIGGDVIVALDGQKVTNDIDINLILNRKRPGDTLTVTLYRGAKKMDVAVKLGEHDGN